MQMDYQMLYHKLFNACTNAISALEQQNFGQARALLITAQQEAEECYISQENPTEAEP
jgi:hypothetical protein